MIHKFRYYYFRSFFHPSATIHELMNEPRKLKHAFFAVCIMAIVYTLVYISLVKGDGRPYKPWLNIAPEDYYKYNRFFLAPFMMFGWILAAGVVHLISKWFHGSGSFEDALCVTGFGVGIASWTTGVHDLISSFLGGVHIINQQHYEVLLNTTGFWRTQLRVKLFFYVVWFTVFFCKRYQGISSTQNNSGIYYRLYRFCCLSVVLFHFQQVIF
jgi:hypothetical protein